MKLTVKIIGTKPMLMHNGRLANPLDKHTRQLKQITSKRKKTDDDHMALMFLEARGSCWETEDGRLGVPTAAVWRSIQDSAKVDKLGKAVGQALLFDPVVQPITVGGRKWSCDEYINDTNGAYIDYRSVKVGTSRTMRARPIISAGWESTFQFELITEVLDPHLLAPVIDRAGRLFGVGDYRPTYGTYRAEVSA